MFLGAALTIASLQCGRRHPDDSHAAFRVRDDLGRDIAFPSCVRRCVSLAPSITESIYFLGRDSLLAGVTSYCDYPEDARRKTVVGDLRSPDLEAIIALQPDVVFLSMEGNTRQTWTKLEQAGIRTFVTNPQDIDGIIHSIERIGTVLGCGAAPVDRMDSLRAVFAAGRGRQDAAASVLFILSVEPLMVAGRETFIDGMISRAGAVNAAHAIAARFPTVNREAILALDPSVVLVSDDLGLTPSSLLSLYPDWTELTAFRRGAVHVVDADLFLRPGPRIGAGMEMMRGIFVSQK